MGHGRSLDQGPVSALRRFANLGGMEFRITTHTGYGAPADAILKLDADPDLRVQMGLRAHSYARASLAWAPYAAAFVAELETWANQGTHAR